MKIAVRLFATSMLFGIAIAAVYWLTTHDLIGVCFLGMMALALIIVAGYIVVAEREANLASDDPGADAAQSVGEEIGAFSLESFWPVLAALGATSMLLGTIYLPGVSSIFVLAGAALVAWTLRFLVREST